MLANKMFPLNIGFKGKHSLVVKKSNKSQLFCPTSAETLCMFTVDGGVGSSDPNNPSCDSPPGREGVHSDGNLELDRSGLHSQTNWSVEQQGADVHASLLDEQEVPGLHERELRQGQDRTSSLGIVGSDSAVRTPGRKGAGRMEIQGVRGCRPKIGHDAAGVRESGRVQGSVPRQRLDDSRSGPSSSSDRLNRSDWQQCSSQQLHSTHVGRDNSNDSVHLPGLNINNRRVDRDSSHEAVPSRRPQIVRNEEGVHLSSGSIGLHIHARVPVACMSNARAGGACLRVSSNSSGSGHSSCRHRSGSSSVIRPSRVHGLNSDVRTSLHQLVSDVCDNGKQARTGTRDIISPCVRDIGMSRSDVNTPGSSRARTTEQRHAVTGQNTQVLRQLIPVRDNGAGRVPGNARETLVQIRSRVQEHGNRGSDVHTDGEARAGCHVQTGPDSAGMTERRQSVRVQQQVSVSAGREQVGLRGYAGSGSRVHVQKIREGRVRAGAMTDPVRIRPRGSGFRSISRPEQGQTVGRVQQGSGQEAIGSVRDFVDQPGLSGMHSTPTAGTRRVDSLGQTPSTTMHTTPTHTPTKTPTIITSSTSGMTTTSSDTSPIKRMRSLNDIYENSVALFASEPTKAQDALRIPKWKQVLKTEKLNYFRTLMGVVTFEGRGCVEIHPSKDSIVDEELEFDRDCAT